ncbi:hypothetical protein KCV03_g10391, partial [Aureobasidium melanogenum]
QSPPQRQPRLAIATSRFNFPCPDEPPLPQRLRHKNSTRYAASSTTRSTNSLPRKREFKLYERELRARYRTPPAPSIQTSRNASPPTPPADQPSGASDTKRDAQGTNDKGHERKSELLGLFTPVYLPLLESRPLGPGRSPSAPALGDIADSSTIVPDRQALQRANTDPAGDNKSPSYKRGLGPRALSSGSDQGRSLVSALESPSAGPRLSNKKRVSLIVGDEVVTPSDYIFSSIAGDSNHRPDDESGAQHIEKRKPLHGFDNETKTANFEAIDGPIALRLLLSHTSGFSHPPYDQHLEAWSRHNDKMASYNGLTGDFYGYFNYRPVARPGAD